MNPAVAEIILVRESLEPPQMEAVEVHPSGIDADHAATVAIYRVFSAADLKAVQVVIAPTEGDLQCLVQLRHPAPCCRTGREAASISAG